MTTENILLIDDDTDLCDLLREYLSGEGFVPHTCHEGPTGLAKALSGEFDLVVLDVMLPGCSGFDVLRELRKKSSVPVLMLTARGDDVDRIVGLEIGADDYLGKPFNPRELIARIRAILRRIRPMTANLSESQRLCLDGIEMEPRARRVFVNGDEIDLTSVEFNLLKTLLACAGTVISRDTLNETVLGRSWSAYDRSIDVHISKLRKKMESSAGKGDCIKAVRGEGYLYAVSGNESMRNR